MLEWAGLGVAVENAVPEVRDAADMVVPGPGRGGIRLLVDRLLADG